MRKFLAALLVVLTLVASIVPVAAADAEVPKGVDGSTANDAESLSLIVTEYLSNSSANAAIVDGLSYKAGEAHPTTYDAFGYIEIYNAGDAAVNLYDYKLVSTPMVGDNSWDKNGKVTAVSDLKSGSIYEGFKLYNNAAAATYDNNYPCDNPGMARIEPGKFAIIWFWNGRTLDIAAHAKENGVAFGDYSGAYHKGFRDHYASLGQEIPEDTTIIAVYASSVYAGSATANAETPRVTLSTSTNTMYALVKDAFDPAVDTLYTKATKTTPAVKNANVASFWSWGTSLGTGATSGENIATTYVPANGVPYMKNYADSVALTDAEKASFVPFTDYLDADYVDSYHQAAAFCVDSVPTPGKMPAYQWLLVDADNTPAALLEGVDQTAEKWQEGVINAYVQSKIEIPSKGEETDEEQREITLLTREEIEKMLNEEINKRNPGGKKYKLLWWGLLLIIVGAVVGVAGIAVLVIVIIKKKKAAAVVTEEVVEGEAAVAEEAVEGTVEVAEEVAEEAAVEPVEETTEE